MIAWLASALLATPLVTWTNADPATGWRKAPLMQAVFKAEHKAFFAPGLQQIAEAEKMGAAPECPGLLGTIDIPTLLERMLAGQRQREGLRRLRRLGLTELDSAIVCLAGSDKALTIAIVGKLKSVTGVLSGLGPKGHRLSRIHPQGYATVDGWLDPREVFTMVKDDELGGRIVASIEAFTGVPLRRSLIDPLTGDFIAAYVGAPGASPSGLLEAALKESGSSKSQGWLEFLEIASELSPHKLRKPKAGRFGISAQGPAIFADVEPTLLHVADREEGLSPAWKKHPSVEAAIAASIDGARYAALYSRVGVAADTIDLLRVIGLEDLADKTKKPPLPKALLTNVGETIVRIDRQDSVLTVRATVNSVSGKKN